MVRVFGRDGSLQVALEGHSGVVNALAIHQDGSLVTGAGDETVRIWRFVHQTSPVLLLMLVMYLHSAPLRHITHIVRASSCPRVFADFCGLRVLSCLET